MIGDGGTANVDRSNGSHVMSIGRTTSHDNEPDNQPPGEGTPRSGDARSRGRTMAVEVTWAAPAEQRTTAGADSTTHAPLTQTLQEQVLRACRTLRCSGELSVVIIDDRHMADLHQRFMGIDQTTDVLTFDLRSDRAAALDGEIYICVDEVRRRATELGHPPAHELLLYAVHGLLHLLGHEDHTPQGYRRMHEAEDRLLERLGVGRVFHAEGGGESR